MGNHKMLTVPLGLAAATIIPRERILFNVVFFFKTKIHRATVVSVT